MKKIDLLKEWYQQNLNFLEELKHRSHIHKNLENASALPHDVFENSEPIFVLSTGRVGTMLLTNIFESCSNVEVHHEALPDMLYAGKYAYENPDQIDWMKGAVVGGRYELVRNAHIRGNRFVETNNRLTFLARGLMSQFPNAKFIHVIRKPQSFVASGVQRGWYTDHTVTDEGRITPPEELSAHWSQADKIAWLWNATNQFCEEFKQEAGPEKVYTLRSEDLFVDSKAVLDLFDWLNMEGVDEGKISQLLTKPVNKSKKAKVAQEFDSTITPLAAKYY